MQFDRAKLIDLVHYVCATADPGDLGAVKLHKILYFSDMLRYLDSGSPLTGETYFKNKHGPTSRHLTQVLRTLTSQNKLSVETKDYFGYPKRAFTSLEDPDMSKFSDAEISLIDMVANFVCKKHTASSISELSHNRAWELAEPGEDLPYFTAFQMVPVEPTEDDFNWAAEEARKIADKRPPAKTV